ncbi:MAG: polysaccharide biosynthesis tyrosine autokinase [Candidatus Aminicenantes bacterium]|nr:MAG: polysaccharide biosynthesis tyrosine autokinase [Candidatus Aminicenantes bacterium]
MPKIEMNLADYLRVIRKRKRIIILTLILVLTSTIYYTRKQTPIYNTSCKVKIEQRKSVAQILTELITWSPADEMASQANLIISYPVMENVAKKLNLTNPGMEEARIMAVVKGIQGQVETAQIEDTNIIAITVTSSRPQEAMNLANTVAAEYVAFHFENKKREASNVRAFVKAQLDSYLRELQASENTLQRFRQDNPLIVERDITSAPLIQSDPKMGTIKDEIVRLELELITLKSKYTDEHPEVITKKRTLEKAKKDLADTLDQLTAQQKEFSAKEIILIQLKRNVDMAEEIYSMFKEKYEEARILEAEKAQDVTIIEPAALPTSPISPNVSFNIIISVFSGLLIGLIMAFVTESLDTTIGRIDDIEELLGVPVLGIIPNTSIQPGKRSRSIKLKIGKKTQEKSELNKRLVVLFEPTSIAAEAYRTLRTSLDLTGLRKVGNSIVITSSAPQEGKTQTLINLAIAFAQSGQKTLIVGSDFRKPIIHKIFGIKRSPGLAEVLIGNISWKKATNTATDMLLGGLEYEMILKSPGLENLHILTSGERTPNPAELLNFPEMQELIQELRKNFDIILYDTPPTLPVADSAILGSKTDGIILVYQAGRTSRYALLRAKNQLENVNAKVWGLIINNLKAKFIEDVTPYQKYVYYRYYGDDEEKTR